MTGYVFSMAAALAPPLLDLDAAALARLTSLGVLQGTGALGNDACGLRATVPLDWPELERVLPDQGLPRGVIEIASPMTRLGPSRQAGSETLALRGGATTLALSAIRAAHAADPGAWCAWITDKAAPSLYAPAVVQAGVDLDRLLVVRPEAQALARSVVKVAASGAFDLVVVDAASGLDGRLASAEEPRNPTRTGRARVDGSVVVRKLALASEEKGTTFLLLTNLFATRPVPWPVALRLEVERRPDAIAVRVTRDRRGRASSQHVVRIAG